MEEQQHQNILIEKKFKETIEKKSDGYLVRLPWKDNAHKLADNKSIAVQRMKSTIIKLAKDPALLTSYHETITQQCKEGVIEQSTNTPFRFGHVGTKDNPADCATRGLNKDELRHHIWWNGPPLIHQLDSNISQFFTLPANYDSYDVSTTMATLTFTVDDSLDWNRQSDLKKTANCGICSQISQEDNISHSRKLTQPHFTLYTRAAIRITTTLHICNRI
ncbi:hypothetical protein DICVIV_09327 [Dictyocaulus viviparus]|uniref:Uncharacterized protein n=1 Tax=Dictyocaulus viviparus TaxID=29172 RepID=A0A0D8XLG3_DICVI|nr:hypothetical protein DICVIV_09327 [Dictyocaulus viviparus]